MDLSALFETKQSLMELDWYDKAPMAAKLKRYVGKWVHFSDGAPNRHPEAQALPYPDKPNYYDEIKAQKEHAAAKARIDRMNAKQRVPKIGIRPSKFHQDPFGIYFYPVNFVLSGTERLRNGQQYGLNMKFYYVVDLALDNRGVNLRWVRWDEVEAIATRNGWIDQMKAFRALPEAEQKAKLPSYAQASSPGSFLWHFVETLVRSNVIHWNKAFAGLTYIRDENQSIIHSNEPDQVLVMSTSIVKVIDSGETKAFKGLDDGSVEQGAYAVLSIMKTIRGEVGGDLTWMKKQPSLKITQGRATFTITPFESREAGIQMSYSYGRAEGSMSMGATKLRTASAQEVVEAFVARIKMIAARKSDLNFKPIIDEKQGRALLTDSLGDGSPIEFTVRIDNEDGKYNAIRLWGKTVRDVLGMSIETSKYMSISQTQISYDTKIRISDRWTFGHASAYGHDDVPQDEKIAALYAEFKENFDRSFGSFAPDESRASDYRYPRFSSIEHLDASKGWMVMNSGLSFEGRFQKDYAAEIEKYQNISDKRDIDYEIRRIFGPRI